MKVMMAQHIFKVCIFLFAAFATPLIAQQHIWQKAMSFRHVSVEQGLSQSTVYASLQDKRGFMWFGTADGLNKYDGYTFTIYRNHQSNPHSLSNNFVQALHEDKAGTLWVGTRDGGLNRFERATGTFTAYKYDPTNAASLSNNYVSSICEDSSGTLWVGTEGGGVNKFDQQTGLFTAYKHDATNPQSLSHNVVFAVRQTRDGMLWIGTQGGLDCFNPRTRAFQHFRRNNSATRVPSLAGDTVRVLFEDSKGILWAGTEGSGLSAFNPKTQTWTTYRNELKNPTSLGNNWIRVIYEDVNGVLWVGTLGGGLHTFNRSDDDPARGAFTRIVNNPNNPRSIGGDAVYSIVQDRSGVLWVGTYGTGLSTFHRNSNAFTTYSHDPSNPQSLNTNGISALCEDRRGAVWVGTWTGGLNRLDRVANDGQGAFSRPKLSLSGTFIRAILEDRAGKLWIGSLGGVDVIDPVRMKIHQSFKHDLQNQNSLTSNDVFTLFEDSKGRIWIGTLGGGLDMYIPESGIFTHFQNHLADTTSIGNNIIRSICEDKRGNIWIGTRGGGLNRYNERTGTFTRFFHDEKNPRSIGNNAMFALYVARDSALWIGTQGGGLCRFDAATETFTTFREEDGLPNNVVYGITEDNTGNLWLSTNKGLAKMGAYSHLPSVSNQAVTDAHSSPMTNPPMTNDQSTNDQRIFRTYDVRDGLQSNEFNGGAYHSGRSGRLYFGGVQGFNEFFPDSIRDNMYVPPVVITSFKKFNRNVIFDKDISELGTIELTYKDDYFSFEFAALNYLLPEENEYQYMLEGFDKDWVNAGTKREAAYTSIDGGTYTFRVRASNNDDVWNETGVSMRVVINPPFWETMWFRVIAVAFIVTLIALLYHLRTKAIREINRRLELQVTERTTEIRDRNNQLQGANEEIQRQLELLDEQTRMIELSNTELQEKNLEVEIERQKSEELLLNVLPVTIANRLKAGEQTIADCFEEVTVLFADIVGFTQLSAQQEPVEVVNLLNRVFSAFDIFSEQYHLEKIKTIGDAYMIVGGIPEAREDHCEAVALMALEMLETIDIIGKTLKLRSPLAVRIGIHTGRVIAGVIGQKKFSYDLWGDTVNTASRMESHGEAGKIHVSEEVYRRLSSVSGHLSLGIGATDEHPPMTTDQSTNGFHFEERGEIEIKGKGLMRTWFLVGR